MTGLAPGEHYYSIETPEYETSPMRYDPPEPPEHGRDWALVVATSAREAVTVAVKAWLKGETACVYDGPRPKWMGDTYCERQRQDGCNPFTGVRAQVMRCEHGFEFRGPIRELTDAHERGHDVCPECDAELQAAAEVYRLAPGETR